MAKKTKQPAAKITAQKITPFLWFSKDAELAVDHYTSVFKKSKVGNVAYYTEGTPGKPGSIMTIDFTLEGQQFTALNGGKYFTFNDSISFVVHCKNQDEIDYYWDNLSVGGKKVQCGWLKDKFGVSWQVVPAILPQLISGDQEKATRVMKALMKMKKLDIEKLKKAAEGVT
ncbi:MAG TPA: VOC family protein [Flavobacteriales bacterium]|nr:VOC family protein [Flavobacteriales bacterium]